jgi:hypothetical protein
MYAALVHFNGLMKVDELNKEEITALHKATSFLIFLPV